MALDRLQFVLLNDMLKIDVPTAPDCGIDGDVMRVNINFKQRAHDEVTGCRGEPVVLVPIVQRQQRLGTLFARAGHEIVFSYARSKKKLERLARDAGKNARAGTPGEAAKDADAILLAVHWLRVDEVL